MLLKVDRVFFACGVMTSLASSPLLLLTRMQVKTWSTPPPSLYYSPAFASVSRYSYRSDDDVDGLGAVEDGPTPEVAHGGRSGEPVVPVARGMAVSGGVYRMGVEGRGWGWLACLLACFDPDDEHETCPRHRH